jgi:hypothetical protein
MPDRQSPEHRPTPGGVHQLAAAPPPARALCTLSRIDYDDAFLVDLGTGGERTAEQWARAVLEGAPSAARRTLRTGWTGIGLKLGHHGGRSVLGWEIRRCTPDVVLLGADSRTGMPGQLLFERRPDGLLFATFVAYQTPAARALWAAVEPVHVPTVRHLLEQARRRCCP